MSKKQQQLGAAWLLAALAVQAPAGVAVKAKPDSAPRAATPAPAPDPAAAPAPHLEVAASDPFFLAVGPGAAAMRLARRYRKKGRQADAERVVRVYAVAAHEKAQKTGPAGSS